MCKCMPCHAMTRKQTQLSRAGPLAAGNAHNRRGAWVKQARSFKCCRWRFPLPFPFAFLFLFLSSFSFTFLSPYMTLPSPPSKCACRESNPGHKHGRLVCYRYTTGALNTRDQKPIEKKKRTRKEKKEERKAKRKRKRNR